jgi:hypothetical protein
MHPDPLLLHHYTSGTGLLGIFDSDSIWATLIHSLNDSREFAHAIEVARGYLFMLRRSSTDDTVNALIETVSESIERISSRAIYVACFSTKEDSLSQWRGYCPPGFGYGLGLFGEELRRIAAPQGFQLHQCIYDHSKQRKEIELWATRTLQDLRATLTPDPSPTEHASKNCDKYFNSFAAFAPILKDQAFKDEDEWRLVGMVPDERVKLRPGRSMLVPYVPITLGLASNPSLVWNITVGPTPHMDLAMRAATHLFRRAKIKNGIGRSMVPYRDW